MKVRPPTPDDLDAIVALTAAKRRRLAAWAPAWWPIAEGADDLHRAWLAYRVGGDGLVPRVLDDDGAVVGCAFSVPQGTQWFIDDVAFAEDLPDRSGPVELLTAIEERPALTCIATLDLDSIVVAEEAGLVVASTYWIRRTEAGAVADARPVPLPDRAAPRHTFGGPFDPSDATTLSISTAGGVITGSPPVAAPPIYATGGTVAIVDRVVGPDPEALLRAALAAAHERGDVLMCVVAGADDAGLATALAMVDFVRTVEVYAWP